MDDRSPIASKYRRVIEGLELGFGEGLASSPRMAQINSSDTQTTISNRNEARQSVYRRLFGPEIANSSPRSLSNAATTTMRTSECKNNSTTASPSSFMTIGDTKQRFNDNKEPLNSDLHFIAPILYGKKGSVTARRPLQSTPIKILDAPGLEDDFYLNLLDWEARTNRVSVLLGGSEVYFWNATNLASVSDGNENAVTGSLGRLRNTNAALIDKGCVIKWSPEKSGPSLLAIGTKNGMVEIWDAERSTCIQSWSGHDGNRCGVLSWNASGCEGQISSGGRDHRIVHYDMRTALGVVGQVPTAHTQEVCGLKYDHYGSGLLASGGNDNQLLVWDRRREESGPLLELNQHTAAVKAIDWSPHQVGLLASGGGTADRTIRFWNTKLPVSANTESRTNTNINCFAALKPIQASSQVCTLTWSPLAPDEILSTHGFSEHNLALWSYPSGRCLGTLDGHSQRVLFQAIGPDGSTVVTGSGDETLRFWRVFRKPAARNQLNGPNRRGIEHEALENVFQASR